MAGRKSWREVHDKLARARDADPDRKARYEELHREARHLASLSQLRRALELTQEQLAETVGLTQPAISQIEQRGRLGDLYLSTLRRYVEAMGGQLEVVAVFDDERISLEIGPSAQDFAATNG